MNEIPKNQCIILDDLEIHLELANLRLDEYLESPDFTPSLDMQGLVKLFHKFKQIKDLMDEVKVKINKYNDRLRNGIVPERMEEAGVQKMTIKGVGTLYLTNDMSVSIKPGMKEDVFNYFRDLDMADLIKEGIDPKTLKAQLKKLFSSGSIVPELFNISFFTRAAIRKS